MWRKAWGLQMVKTVGPTRKRKTNPFRQVAGNIKGVVEEGMVAYSDRNGTTAAMPWPDAWKMPTGQPANTNKLGVVRKP